MTDRTQTKTPQKTCKFQTFVISLERATERRARMAALLRDIPLDYRLIDAVDGSQLDLLKHPEYNRARRLRYYGRDMLTAELGCALSHKRVYELIVRENIELSLVFEDDVVLFDLFHEVLEKLTQLDTGCYDMIRFFGRDKVIHSRQKKVAALSAVASLTRLQATPGGAYAYLITRRGAEKMLDALTRIDSPIDFIISRCWLTGLDAYAVHPHTVYVAAELGSDIGETRFDKTPTIRGFSRAVFPLFRAALRLSEMINKRWWYMRENFRKPDLSHFFSK